MVIPPGFELSTEYARIAENKITNFKKLLEVSLQPDGEKAFLETFPGILRLVFVRISVKIQVF